MTSDDRAAADLERSSERWLAWLAGELARRHRPEGEARPGPPEPAARGRPSGVGLLVLWDVLEEWFGSDDFAGSPLAAAMAAPPDGRGPAAHAVLARHREATRRLLEDVAAAAGASDPAVLAAQLLVLVEGAVVGALVDRHPGVARHARELTEIVLARPSG